MAGLLIRLRAARALRGGGRHGSTSAQVSFLDRLLRAMAGADRPARPSAARPPGLVEPLSGRELEVLRLIAAGRANAEIARALIVAPSTVRSHVNHLFGKLGVASRTQAVARARDLDLL